MNGLLDVIRNIDLSIYHFLSRFAGNWVLDRIAVYQEGNVLFKAGLFVAAYWYFWFRPGNELETRRRKVIATHISFLKSV